MGLFYKLFYENQSDGWIYDYSEIFDSNMSDVLGNFANGQEKINWRVVPAGRLIKIWKDFAKMGIIRDEKGLQKIKNLIINNIARLEVTNVLTGHTQSHPFDYLEMHGYEDLWDEDEDEMKDGDKFYYDYLSGDDSGFVSDYGLPKLQKILPELYNAKTPEEILYAIDKVLNVVHQRSDLSTLFVQGGQSTLNEIANYQGD